MTKAPDTDRAREPAAAERPMTLHQRIKTDLETRILSGQWHTGYRIPTEKELAAQYGCSRITVSKVLMLLAQKGLIESRKRAGSFVRRPPEQSIILQILDPASVADQMGEPYAYEMLWRSSGPGSVADKHRLRVSKRQAAEVLTVRCRHFIGARVYCFEERLINLTLLPAAADVDFAQLAPGDWLIDFLPWRSGDATIGAALLEVEIAEAMHLPEGSAALTIERQIHADGAAVSCGMSWYAGDMTRLTARYQTARAEGPE